MTVHLTVLRISGLALVTALALGLTVSAQPSGVSYPADYRTWAVVKSGLVGPAAKNFATRGGFHHFYANATALEGYRTGRFADGAVIVDEGVWAEDVQGVWAERGRRSLDVMQKDGARFAATGGWGFDHFDGDVQQSTATAEAKTACATCHATRKDHGYVFSTFRR